MPDAPVSWWTSRPKWSRSNAPRIAKRKTGIELLSAWAEQSWSLTVWNGESQVLRRDLMEKLISECQTWSTLMTKHLPAEALRSTSNAQRDWWINMTCDRRLNRPIDCPNTQYTHVYACLSTQQELCQQPSCDASCEKRLCIASSQPGLSLKTSKPSKWIEIMATVKRCD